MIRLLLLLLLLLSYLTYPLNLLLLCYAVQMLRHDAFLVEAAVAGCCSVTDLLNAAGIPTSGTCLAVTWKPGNVLAQRWLENFVNREELGIEDRGAVGSADAPNPRKGVRHADLACRGVDGISGQRRAVGDAHDRPVGAVVDGTVDSSGDRGGQRNEDYLAALAAHAHDPVAVFFAEVGDARAAGFEDPQTEQAQKGDQGEVVRVRGQPGVVIRASNCRWPSPRVGDSAGTWVADVVGRLVRQDGVDTQSR